MANTTLAGGRTFIRAGKPFTSLYRILEGTVSAFRQGEEFLLHTGDIIGICELGMSAHIFSYKTMDNCVLESNSCCSFEDFTGLLQDTGFAQACLRSSFTQAQSLYEHYFQAMNEASSLYHTCMEDENEYLMFCKKYRISPKPIPAMDTLAPFSETEPPADWEPEYYRGFQRILQHQTAAILEEPDVLTGLLWQNSRECKRILTLSGPLNDYLCRLHALYFSGEQPDFFTLFSSLLFEGGLHSEDAPAIQQILTEIVLRSENSLYCDRNVLHRKTLEYQNRLASSSKSPSVLEEVPDFSGSLQKILSFSSLSEELQDTFTEKIRIFCGLKDRFAGDDNTILLRKEITDLFYQLYESIVLNSLECGTLPEVVQMFLYFGYVDETLAGLENAGILYHSGKLLSNNKRSGFYTLYDWLLAIYRGEKEPSRNTFDEDYSDCLHAQKINGKITEREEKQFLNDHKQKLLFELHNMFPNVNKMTFGRISTYCPVFSDQNLFKSPDSALVTFDAAYHILDRTVKADFQAFYRETVYQNEACGISKEYIHVEYLPDIILMPCAGTRSVMWQEIEGKKRTTPARFMLPVFQMEDLTTSLLHAVGAYRWEMCKRIQGGRWNDVTERSLTSEYFDYLQFYKKNLDLTSEAKEKVKSSLIKCKNSFKEMFVQDYMTWVLYESTGSPRLNKAARTIFMSHCPFGAAIRNELAANPIYKELVERYELKNRQKLHRMDNFITKIQNTGKEVPEPIREEYHFYQL